MNNKSDKQSGASVEDLSLRMAETALERNRIDVLRFLGQHPGKPISQLLPILNCRSNVLGMVIAAYNAAQRTSSVRELSFDLLTRQIIQEYPAGWQNGGEIHPAVMISNWFFLFKQCIKDQTDISRADSIFRSLAIDDPPPEGWRPLFEHDPLLTERFDRFWPT